MISLSDDLILSLRSSGYDPIWYVSIKSGYTPWSGGIYYHIYSTRALAHSPALSDATYFSNRLASKSISGVKFSINPDSRGGIAQTGAMKFKIANHDLYEDQLEQSSIYYDGKEVSLWLSNGGDTNYGNDICVYTGTITEIDITDDWIDFRTETFERSFSVQIPLQTYQTDDPGGDWEDDQILRNIEGKAIPMVFGEVDMCEGYTIGDSYDTGSVDAGRVVQFCDSGWSSARPIDSLEDVCFGSSGLVDASGGIAEIDTASGRSPWTSILDSGDPTGRVYFDDELPENLWLKVLIDLRSPCSHKTGQTGVTDQELGINNKNTDYAYVPGSPYQYCRNAVYRIPPIDLSATVNSATGDGSALEIYFVGKIIPEVGGNWTVDFNVAPYDFLAWGVGISAGVFGEFGYFHPAYLNGSDSDIDNWWTATSWEMYPIRQRDALGSITVTYYDDLTKLSNGWVTVGTLSNDSGQTTGYIHVYHSALYVKCRIPWPNTGILAHVKGYQDTSSSSYGVGAAVIENPAHLAGWMWQMLSPAGSTRVNTSEHRDVGDDERTGWKFGRQLMDRDDIENVVDGLCGEALLWQWWDRYGKARIFANTDPGPGSTHSLLKRDVIGGKLTRRKRAPAKNIVTDFTMRYHRNPITNDYDRALFCNAGASSAGIGSTYEDMCADAEERYTSDIARVGEYEFDWVRDDDTAIEVFKVLIEMLTKLRWEIEFEGDLPMIVWEMGDAFRFDPADWSDLALSVRSATYRISSVRPDPESHKFVFKAMEVV